ncbi:hypothetical protein CLV98_10945 [Dyadobacter jejuensis]|uniref:Gliding motility-associated lipoprotein GldB n=1 Tax=Dyadobacter jejuensis TaxID=1082580 RepID=A0A316AGM1_9BACT|nr:gliding motility protein [Dyadobacter jejuensis]PWJ56936.1 hypothetical protein CLV98_10945 [Dyadobacter jejuensis]
MNKILFLFLLLAWASCDVQRQDDPKNAQALPLVYENLDKELLAATSAKDVEIILNKHPRMGHYYFSDFEGTTAELAQQLFQIIDNPDFQRFSNQIDSLVGNRETAIINPLQQAFGNIKSQFPSFQAPKIAFIQTGFLGNDLYVSDSLIVVGLDYFGGPQAAFRPQVFDYQLRRYQSSNIVPAIIYYISERYNRQDPQDQTLLADMIGIGKSFEFVKQVLPEYPDSLIIGYSEDNLRRAYNSQGDIWAYIIGRKLLYETNIATKDKYLGERPFVVEMGPDIPGGIGRWIGWRIVNKYVSEHPEVTLPELMNMDKAGNLLQEARYKGEKDEEE